MKGQKQSRTDALEKRMAAVTNVLQHLENETVSLKKIVTVILSGQQQIIKQLKGYEDAIEEIKKKVAEKPSEGEGAISCGTDS